MLLHQTGTCTSGDVTIFYRRLGSPGRTPVVFVHGLSYFSYDWLPVASALGGRECVAMDMRGFGDSSSSAHKDYSVPAMARDIVNLLDHLGWASAVLVGHSMGGRSTAYLAAKQPQRVAGLVLVDYSPDNAAAGSNRVAKSVAGVPDVFRTIEDAMWYFDAGRDKRPRYVAYLKPLPEGFGIKRDPYFRDQFRRVLETGERPKLGVDMWQVLAEIECPTLVVRASRSDLFAPETVPKVRAANPRFTITEVDSGHDVASDNPTALVAAVEPFLAKLEENPK
jgi:pimeloyl-ACP methyl ester carboxylesterase